MPISNVFNMDCMLGMKEFPDKFFELAIVDPDFGLNEKISSGGTWAAKYKKGDGFLGGLPDDNYFTELFRVSKNQIIWGGNYFSLPPTRCVLTWHKVAYMETLADFELAWTSFDMLSKTFFHVRNTSESRIHITQKPIKLYRWLLQNYAKPNDKILDTHLGSQSSRIAAYKLGFDFWGYELDEDYFKQGCERFEKSIAEPLFDAPKTFEQGNFFTQKP